MSFKEKDLECALFRLGHLSKRELMLVIWTDTDKNCKPMADLVKISFQKIKDESAKNIIRGINSKQWILAIVDDHENVYQITSAQEFANKSCEEKKIPWKPERTVMKTKKEIGEKKDVGKRKTSSS